MLVVDSVGRIALAVLGITGGTLLLLRHARAVAFIRVYLLAFAIACFALISLPWVFGLPLDIRNHVIGALIYRAAMTVPATSFWFLYFKHSKRVKVTYSGIEATK